MTDAEKIQHLSNDNAFGVLTRQGLELAMCELEINERYIVYVLDLTGIHKLNSEFGYEIVNTKIRTSLECIKLHNKDSVIGRLFSGDELVIIQPAESNVVNVDRVISIFKERNIGFKYLQASYYGALTLEIAQNYLDNVSKQLHNNSYCQIV